MNLIHEKGTPDMFCTLNAANLKWPDLHYHMPQTIGPVVGDPQVVRQRWQVSLNKNPHITTEYLDQQIQTFFQEFLVPFLDWEALKKPDAIISLEQKIKMEQFTEYWNWFIITLTPFPCHHDENTPLIGEHPCSIEQNTLNNTKKSWPIS